MAFGSGIKQIQYGTINVAGSSATGTGTLSPAVVVANTVVLWLGNSSDSSSGAWAPQDEITRITLTDTTTVTATRNNTGASALVVGYVAIEYY